ncbi:autophagy protein 5-like [Hibiscus syriacus]|nr:autophagy protein 5-like [Hibiscus syriacus]
MAAQKYVWEGAIPLQIHLHESQVTALPPPPPALILAPRIGYLPLLAPLIKPYFSSTLPPGVDTIWFDYNGLPLKWYIPTGVLFDLLCPEPERPWNITVHFRGYPGNVLIPCEGEDSVKWSFINSLKEAAYIMNGNCKNVMNMSQSDQLDLWNSIMNGNLEAYQRVSSKHKLSTVDDEYTSLWLPKSQQSLGETDLTAQVKTGRVPVRLYVLSVREDFHDLDEMPRVDSWEKISYINRPVEIRKEDKCFTLHDALKTLLPELFSDESLTNVKLTGVDFENATRNPNEDVRTDKVVEDQGQSAYKNPEGGHISGRAEIKLIRIQGIEPKLEIPFSWVANNLINPDYFLHICVYAKVGQ